MSEEFRALLQKSNRSGELMLHRVFNVDQMHILRGGAAPCLHAFGSVRLLGTVAHQEVAGTWAGLGERVGRDFRIVTASSFLRLPQHPPHLPFQMPFIRKGCEGFA